MLYMDLKKQEQQLIRLAELPPAISLMKNDEYSWSGLQERTANKLMKSDPHLCHRLNLAQLALTPFAPFIQKES